MLLEIPLSGEGAGHKSKRCTRLEQLLEEIAAFLKLHPTAKIIILINTHCLEENGSFIYAGNGSSDYLACRLYEVCTELFGAVMSPISHVHRSSGIAFLLRSRSSCLQTQMCPLCTTIRLLS
jgi:hypothetical protein